MRIVHIEDFFHPDAGYQINILPKYQVEQGHTVTIVTSKMDRIPYALTEFFGRNDIEERDQAYSREFGVEIIRLPLLGHVSGRAVFSTQLFSTVEHLSPDVLFMHGNDTLTGMRYLFKVRKLSFPVVMDSHMLEMASRNRFSKLYRALYKRLYTPIILKNKIPVIRTQNDNYVQRHLGIPIDQCPWISVGSDTMLFHPDEKTRAEFRNKYEINKEDFVVVYTGKLDEDKGGILLAEAFKKKFPCDRNVVLVAVGNTTGEYGQRVEEEFLKSENRIIRFATQKYTDLPKYYQAADLSVFPKQCSLSFYDAQACGLPVVSEANNINIERLDYNNGFVYQCDDIEDLRSKILKCLDMPGSSYEQMCQNAYHLVKNQYDYEQIAEQYTNILMNEYQRFENRRNK